MIGDVVDKVYIKGYVLIKSWANKFGRKKEGSCNAERGTS